MTRRIGAWAVTMLLACAGAPALVQPTLAQPAYTANDIVSAFAPSLGGARGVCVGSDSECVKRGAESKKAGGFDLVVTFDYNSDTLTAPARTNLDQFATALKDPRLGRAAFVVEGHTDGAGGDEFNLDLSMRRAGAVVKYLETRGIAGERLEAKGYGKQRPVAADPLAPANRRVETRLRTD